MHKRKLNLQRHRVAAFSATLEQIELKIESKILFMEEWGEVYKFPVAIKNRSISKYKRLLKAAQALKELQYGDVM